MIPICSHVRLISARYAGIINSFASADSCRGPKGSGLSIFKGKSRVPGKAKPANSKVGPFSRDRAISTLDKRTKAGRVLRTVISDLTDHIGGAPSAAEALIIQSAALKATRLHLLSEKLLAGGDMAEASDHHALAWLNSMRLDLAALGLERRIKDVSPSLADIAASLNKGGPA